MLAGERCRAIVAISEFARSQFLRQHEGGPEAATLAAKVRVRYPNTELAEATDPFIHETGMPLRLVFVGNHFARKGGLVALRMADLAHQRAIPLHLTIISSLEVGASSWVDPLDRGFFAPYFDLLSSLPNVNHLGTLENRAVLDQIAQAHFLLLPTLSDTFGFSVLEAFAHHTPVVATAQGALTEFIRDGENSLLLPLETDAWGEWVHLGRRDRDQPAYGALFKAETDRLAEEGLARMVAATQTAEGYRQMRRKAYETAEQLFAAGPANQYWDDLYPTLL
ncbi:glycosyltransferase [Pararhodospirillum oryzae]|nr:glycosyltransferase [Pararhodospirillum oryzae]